MRRSEFGSPSPHGWGEGRGEGRVSSQSTPKTVRPECPRSGCIEGPCAAVSAVKPLRFHQARLRALTSAQWKPIFHPCRSGFAVLGADNGGTVKSQVKSTPHPGPLPQGERGRKGEARAFDVALAFDVLWTFLPVVCAEHHSPRRQGLAASCREARQDAEASIVRPGTACRWTPPRARSAGHPEIAAGDCRAQTPGRRFLVTSFRCRKEVTRPWAEPRVPQPLGLPALGAARQSFKPKSKPKHPERQRPL